MSPRRFRALPLAAAVTALSLLSLPAALRAQEPAPGTLDDCFDITRTHSSPFIPSQTDFTPFAIALQPGQDPVNPGSSNIREIPAARTKLLIAGDGATLYRAYLTRTFRVVSVYSDGTVDGFPVGVVQPIFTVPFEAGDADTFFTASYTTDNGFGSPGRTVYSLSVNPDGGILAGGIFGPSPLLKSVFRKQDKNFILLNFNGDTEITNITDANGAVTSQTQGPFNLNVGAGANDSVLAILRRTTFAPGETDGRILLGGQFLRFNKQDRGRLVQLLPDGTSDTVFNANIGSAANGIVFSLAEAVDPALVQFGILGATNFPNGQTYVCGDFDTFNGKGPGKLVRLNEDGTRDPTFAPSIAGRAIAVAVQPDGNILVGGDLDTINGVGVNNLARLFPDGSLDLAFLANAKVNVSIPNNIPPTSVYVLKVQPDGRILVGGNYHQLDGVNRDYLGRLNADGTLDASFDADGLLPDPTHQDTNVPGIISNAVQSVVAIPRDPSLGNATDLIYSQTRADRKQVAGDSGFFPNPVRRLFGDDNPSLVAFPSPVPAGAPVVRIGADGPTATVGDLTPQPDLAGAAVPDPGTRGVFRITREGDTTNALSVTVKLVNGSAPAAFNSAFNLRQLIYGPDDNTGQLVLVALNPEPGPKFVVSIPKGQRSVDVLVEPLNDGIAQPDQTVTLKLKAAPDGSSYALNPVERVATVTILANNR